MLLTHLTLVNWSPREVTPNQAILIREGRILEIGTPSVLREKYPAEETLNCKGRYVFPGNLCAHTHFYGAYARGMAIPGAPPRDFPEILRRLWWPLDKSLDAEAVKYSALVCLVDSVKHGTTTLFDHHASPNAISGSLSHIADAVTEAGVRAVLCYEVTDRDGIDKAEAGIAENVRFIQQVRENEALHGQLAGLIGLHAAMTLSDETLRKCTDAAMTLGTDAGLPGFHIHVAEHEADEEHSHAVYGRSVVQRLAEMGILGGRTITAHNIHIDAWEMGLLRETGTWITHQPRSNMNNGVGAMPLEEMLRGGLNVCLGNDGFSNDMVSEWKAAYLLHKLAHRDPRRANGDDIATIATTHNAALAESMLGIPIGRIAPGYVADLMVVDYHPYTPLTAGNLAWHVLFGVESSMCVGTICNGRVLQWERELKTLDEAAIMAGALAKAPEVWAKYREMVK
jgi:putative selenium metabolism protein SsnA